MHRRAAALCWFPPDSAVAIAADSIDPWLIAYSQWQISMSKLAWANFQSGVGVASATFPSGSFASLCKIHDVVAECHIFAEHHAQIVPRLRYDWHRRATAMSSSFYASTCKMKEHRRNSL